MCTAGKQCGQRVSPTGECPNLAAAGRRDRCRERPADEKCNSDLCLFRHGARELDEESETDGNRYKELRRRYRTDDLARGYSPRCRSEDSVMGPTPAASCVHDAVEGPERHEELHAVRATVPITVSPRPRVE